LNSASLVCFRSLGPLGGIGGDDPILSSGSEFGSTGVPLSVPVRRLPRNNHNPASIAPAPTTAPMAIPAFAPPLRDPLDALEEVPEDAVGVVDAVDRFDDGLVPRYQSYVL
jgi:hypothetical protein